jgi:hypothetical protein
MGPAATVVFGVETFPATGNYILLQKIAPEYFRKCASKPIAAGCGFYSGDGLALLPKSHIKHYSAARQIRRATDAVAL